MRTQSQTTTYASPGNQAFGQGMSAHGIEGSRTPLFAELPDVSAYFATDHTFQPPGEKASAIFPINSRCNRQTSPPDAGKLNCASNVRRIPAAQRPGRLDELERCAWSPEAILRA